MYELGHRTTIDHDTSRTGRWLRERRSRIALWLAVVEVVIAALTHDVSKWTIIVAAAVLVPLHLLWGRERSDAIRQVTWIAATSQALAIVGVVAAFVIGAFVLLIAGLFALAALAMIFSDRR